jgi:hypothetical protein
MRLNSTPVGVRTEAGINASRRDKAFLYAYQILSGKSMRHRDSAAIEDVFKFDAALFDWFALLTEYICTILCSPILSQSNN